MRLFVASATLFLASALFAAKLPAQDTTMPNMPGMASKPDHDQHHHVEGAALQPQFPRMGRSQEHAQGSLLTLEQAQKLASDTNPTLRQAGAEIRAAKARQHQVSLYPNPAVGYTADEIRGGSGGGGKQGFFVQQTIVTGNKLALSRDVFGQNAKLAEIEAEEQRTRVQTAVKLAFLRVLAAQELLDARRDLTSIAADSAETQRRLMNTGQADETEVLAAEIDAQRLRMSARMQENTLREEWRSLAAVLGQPSLQQQTVAGTLESDWPQINEEEAVEAIAKQSPAIRIADAAADRAAAVLARANRESVPDLQLRGGMEYNNELLQGTSRAKGWEGIAEVSLQLPVFNRNQGNLTAASADITRAAQEKLRVSLTLRERAASVVDQYANARLMATEYRDELLPRAKKSYSLMLDKYGRMLASYPRVLESQRKLYESQLEYIAALENLWINGIALQGFLLTDGLEAPARPGEVDRPVRETNVPMPDRTMSPNDSRP